MELTNNSNNYNGATTISGGTLQLGDGVSANGNVSTNITNNAALVFANPTAQTYAYAISGSGNVIVSGPGATTLSGNNPYTGPTTVNAGTLQIGNGTSGEGLASPTIALNNGATLAFNHADGLSYSGVITAAGS